MLSQRIPNMAGVCATEHSPFGYLCCERDKWGGDMGKISGYEKVEKTGKGRTDPFNELYIRTWRDLARYQGPEALGQEGPAALMRLPAIMEDIFEAWEKAKNRPHQQKLKEIRVRPKTGEHDVETKINQARKFLEHNDKVLVNVLFRGRELQHIEEGRRIIDGILEKLAEVAKIEKAPSMEGKRMTAMLAPKSAK